MVGGFGADDTPCTFSWHQFTRWGRLWGLVRGGLWGLVPDLEIGYKTAKPWDPKVELFSSAKISTVFAEAHQLRKAMQAEDSEEASQPSSLTTASVSQSCVACVGLIPLDWPCRFQCCWLGWPATEEAASTWEKTKWAYSVAAHR